MLGCAAPGPDGSGPAVLVPNGKEDDFLSESANEYVVSGRSSVTLDEADLELDDEARLARVQELVGYQQIAIAWFLNSYLIDKKSGDSNEGFGGFGAMARANTYDDLDLQTEDERTYSFYFEQLVAGDRSLMSRLPIERVDGEMTFVLTMGAPTNAELARLETNNEWYRQSPWSAWNPEDVSDEQKVDLTLVIRPEEESDDAWFDYAALMDDGVLDIDVHMGWDYHDAYHVRHSEALFHWLRREGFEAPVASFEELDRDSGPFTREIEANGRPVLVEVRIFYGHPDGETDPDTDAGGRILEDDMRGSLRTRDVIMYSGHSGPFYGFALGNWRMTDEGDLDDSEMRTVEMPRERYQIVVAEGCDTYQIGEAFRNNPAKPDGRFIDIITTTAPSNASTSAAVQDVISSLLRADELGRHDPQPIRALLRDLDSNSRWFQTMYGVHGIDDNPQLHPWAQPELSCAPCATDDDCGGPGNRCVSFDGESSYCAPTCTTDAGCGEGFCRQIADSYSWTIDDSVCVPSGLRCE